MNEPLHTEKAVITRKQFLSIVGASFMTLLFSHFFLPSKQTYLKDNSYGSSNYGNRS